MGTEQSVHRSRAVIICDGTMTSRLRNNYFPLHFHHVHGDNIKLSRNKTVACRSEGFCNGIVFSDRPIQISEPVYVKFLETSPNWSGALRIGFTMHDPTSLKSRLPRYACPDLTSMHGNWAKAVGEKFAKKDSILYYYVDQNGDVHYGIGSEEYGIFFGGVNTSGKLWAVLDVYGNTVAVEFMDPNLLNRNHERQFESMSSVESIPTSIFQSHERASLQGVTPLLFHTVHGKNVTLRNNRTIASKKHGISSLAYVFTECPVELDKTIRFSIQHIDYYQEGPFVYGITSCDPRKIDPLELPENEDDLFDRSEYWIVNKKVYSFEVGDSLTFKISSQGLAEFSINGDHDAIFYVDYSQPLWMFMNLTQSICQIHLEGVLSNFSSVSDEVGEAFNHLALTESYKTGIGAAGPSGQQSSSECVICYEEQVDCVLYRCGHMCMCFNCASKLFKSDSSAHCPICRNIVKDVIKIYK